MLRTQVTGAIDVDPGVEHLPHVIAVPSGGWRHAVLVRERTFLVHTGGELRDFNLRIVRLPVVAPNAENHGDVPRLETIVPLGRSGRGADRGTAGQKRSQRVIAAARAIVLVAGGRGRLL